ncbi:hypothetical protein NUW54_g11480 [Trametes sanguinea]|uniref:Uncharacterized protein n=1 Tax=Trametes sanguinea TaxID=158606 RepID=A0ACC1NCI2_9APHY|nr:hypothetical protein NUW54_g11480 [Trametes sanguinea]
MQRSQRTARFKLRSYSMLRSYTAPRRSQQQPTSLAAQPAPRRRAQPLSPVDCAATILVPLYCWSCGTQRPRSGTAYMGVHMSLNRAASQGWTYPASSESVLPTYVPNRWCSTSLRGGTQGRQVVDRQARHTRIWTVRLNLADDDTGSTA